MKMIEYSDFEKVDIRVGTIIEALEFPKARKPAYILMINFGEKIGIKKSSVQIVSHYELKDLVGRQIMGVVNFAPRQIGPIKSEVLTLGFEDESGEIVLAAIDKKVPNGQKLM